MMQNSLHDAPPPFRPLVVGTPRSGFVLLTSIAVHLNPLAVGRVDLRRHLLNVLIDTFGDLPARSIVEVVERHGLGEDLVYNDNFRKLVGGPKWITPQDPDTACFRKYVGLRGKGDFMLITTHPREVLEYDEVIHSHSYPALWPDHPGYNEHVKFASVRSPVGIINSAMFSLNALASEYIQRFLPPEQDNDILRQRLALYKFTDLTFFEGIVRFYKDFFATFSKVADRYILMRWEDLILDPPRTISRLAREAGLPVDEDHAAEIWRPLDHVNLTGAHKHNYRRGKGIVGDWRNWMTNHHLRILREAGFDEHLARFGYDPIPHLDEDSYTAFQREVDARIQSGRVFRDTGDPFLFGFAFNKSNIDASQFSNFKVYPWKKATRVERSDISQEEVVLEAWEAAERAVLSINEVFNAFLGSDFSTEQGVVSAIAQAASAAAAIPRRDGKDLPLQLASMERLARLYFSAVRKGALPRFDYEGRHRPIREVGDFDWMTVAGRYEARPRLFGLSVDHTPDVPVVRAPTYKALLERMASPPSLEAFPVRVRSVEGYTIVRLGRRWWGVPTSNGDVDLTRTTMDAIPGVLHAGSEEDLLAAVASTKAHLSGPFSGLATARCAQPSEWLEHVGRAIDKGARRVFIRPFNALGEWLSYQIGTRWPAVEIHAEPPEPPFVLPAGIVGRRQADGMDLVLLTCDDQVGLQECLRECMNLESGTVLFPYISGGPQDRPLFIVSIPKAGTHLVTLLAKALGYQEGGVHDGNPSAGSWYYLEYSNAHTVARDFFVDSVRRSSFGMRHHPFPSSPVLFNYRHPLDILVSEANYYSVPGKTVFSGYLANLDYKGRLLRLVNDPWLLGSLRERVGGFVAWLDFPNVIPVSFEELVGGAGGSSDEACRRLVWSLMLKLQVQGDLGDVLAGISDRTSPTFREGRVGNWREEGKFPLQVRDRIGPLENELITAFGYALPDWSGADASPLPVRAVEYRARPLCLLPDLHQSTPILEEVDYLGHNLVRYHTRYYAVPTDSGPMDLTTMTGERLSAILSEDTVGKLKALVIKSLVQRVRNDTDGTGT